MRKRPSFFKVMFWLLLAVGLAWFALAPADKPQRAKPVQVTVAPLPPEKPEPPPHYEGEEPVPSPAPEAAAPKPVEPAPAVAPSVHVPRGTALIALVIDDVGVDLRNSRRAVALPAPVTLSYLPYGTRLRDQTREAMEAGHELMLHVPMEPMGHADPGPNALLTNLSSDEVRQRLQTALASFTGYDGMNNHMGSKFTSDSAMMALVMDELAPRGVFFLDSRTSPQSVGADIAKQKGVPAISRDVFLDDDMSAKAVRTQIEQTERIARRKGYAVAIGHPHPVTLQELEAWIPDAQQRGFTFVPIKNLVNHPSRD